MSIKSNTEASIEASEGRTVLGSVEIATLELVCLLHLTINAWSNRPRVGIRLLLSESRRMRIGIESPRSTRLEATGLGKSGSDPISNRRAKLRFDKEIFICIFFGP